MYVPWLMQEHSPDSSDLLPGLCALSQSWLGDVVLSSFRETSGNSKVPTLTPWFDNFRVSTYLRVS